MNPTPASARGRQAGHRHRGPRLGPQARATGVRRTLRLVVASLLVTLTTGCAVVAVADAAVTVAATGVKIVAKAVGAAVDAVTPESKKPQD